MFRKFRRSRCYQWLALLLLLAFLPSCTSWHTIPATSEAIQGPKPLSSIRVTLADHSTIVLDGPAIIHDTLVGLVVNGPDLPVAPGGPFRVPLDQVRQVEARHGDVGKTIVLLAGIGAAVAMVATLSGNSDNHTYSPPPEPNLPISCPLVYSWDGTHWRLDSGTFGGAITRGAQRTDVDNLMYIRPDHGALRFRVANRAPETDHIDALSVLAVDHAPGITIAPDGAGGLHTIGTPIPPARAVDGRGADILPRIAREDGWQWASPVIHRDTARTSSVREALILSFPFRGGSRSARLVVDGRNTTWAAQMMSELVALHGAATAAWYDSLDQDPDFLRRNASAIAQTAFLQVSVWNGNRWLPQGLLPEAGPELAKRQVIPIELLATPDDTVRIRLETAPGFWLLDRVALDTTAEQPYRVTELHPQSAVMLDGRDVSSLLAGTDNRYLTLESGDIARVRFHQPPVPAGMVRSYILRSTGWYRIHSPMAGEPSPLLTRVGQPGALSRLTVARLNQELAKVTP